MSERESGLSSIGDAIGMAVLIFAIVMFFIVVAIVTFLASPGMLIVGTAKLAFGLTHSTRQVWVLSIAASLTILIVLIIVRRNVAEGVALHLLLCAATMILWSVLTYGFESKATEALAAVFFPGFTMNEVPEEKAAQVSREGPAVKSLSAVEAEMPVAVAESQATDEFDRAVVRRAKAASPFEDEPPPTPTPIPTPIRMASFNVAFQLPIERAYVMVRLNDREVFRSDFRPAHQAGMSGLVTPSIEVAAGPAVVKVWVISPDKKAADEYVVVPLDLGAGESRRLALVLDPGRPLKERLVVERGARPASRNSQEEM
ncbi:MAG: hypothetical protein ACHQ50_16400 [Fimbriimonadales bacterium]